MVAVKKTYRGSRLLFAKVAGFFSVLLGFIALFFLPTARPLKQIGLSDQIGSVDYAQADFATPPADSAASAASAGSSDSADSGGSGGSSDSGGSGC